MADSSEAIEKIEELINADGSVELPGLDLDTVAENFVDAKYETQLESIEDEKEREELREKWVDYYKNGEGKETLQLEIANIKAKYGAAVDQLEYAQEAAAATVATAAIPSVITVGSATSTPNPAYTLIENKQKKNQLLATLKQIGAFIVDVIKSFVNIAMAIPDAIITLITTLTTVKQTVNAIPV